MAVEDMEDDKSDATKKALKAIAFSAPLPFLLTCDPLGARTQDPNIKSVVLYQLS